MNHTFAVGVLEALKMYASCISCLAEVVEEKCRWTWESRCFEAVEEFRREDMAVRAVRKDIIDQKIKTASRSKDVGGSCV
jgi:hypothetical protein